MDDASAEIVELFPDRDLTDDDAPIRRDPKTSFCRHHKTRLDRDARRIYCRECDAEVDSFTVIDRLVADSETWIRHRKEAERRARAAQTRLEEILRLERNARSRLKKIDPEAKPPERPWGEGSMIP